MKVFLLMLLAAPMALSFSVVPLGTLSHYSSTTPASLKSRMLMNAAFKSSLELSQGDVDTTSTILSLSTATTTTRRIFGQRLLVTTATSGLLLGSSLTSQPLAARASNIDPELALRNIRRAQRQLETKLKPLLDAQQYQEVRDALRADPLGSIRKNCFALIQGEQETRLVPAAEAYQKFIAALERLDATAGLIIRGRNVPELQMQEYYQTTVQSLQVFIDLVASTTTTSQPETTSPSPAETTAQ